MKKTVLVVSKDHDYLRSACENLERRNVDVVMVRSPFVAAKLLGLTTPQGARICSVCNEENEDKDSAATHRCKLSNIKVIKCPVLSCDESFTKVHLLQWHQTRHHGLSDRRCPVCEKDCGSERAVKRHMPSHKLEHSKLKMEAKFNLLKNHFLDLEDKDVKYNAIAKQEEMNTQIGDSTFVDLLNKKKIKYHISGTASSH